MNNLLKLNNEAAVFALGGLGEVGKNMYVIQYEDELIIVDSGILFPDEYLLGIDYVIPEYSYLIENQDKIKALIVSHGHEDHIGGIPFLVQQVNIPVIYASGLSYGLIQAKLEEKVSFPVNLKKFSDDDVIKFNKLEIDFFRTNHSIPDTFGIRVKTPAGSIVHTGDFKFDFSPTGKDTNYHKMAKIGDEGVLCLLSDSTNAELEDFTTSEKVVSETIREMFEDIEGRVIIATFASNIHRIQQIIEASVSTGRKIAVFGRSMLRNIEVGMELGYINVPKNTFIDTRNRNALKNKELTIISTGSQGEPFAALTRIANKSHRQISLIPGDTVILSSSPIPGNQESVNKTINLLQKNGANVIVQSPFADVHASGHGGQSELKLMLKLMKPKFFAPIHGEHRMLKAHQQLAIDTGVEPNNTFILENGLVLAFSNGKAYIKGKVKTSDVYVDSESIGEVGSMVIKDRRELSEDGLLSVVLTISQQKYEVICMPNIVSKGFIFVRDNFQMIKDMQKIVIESSKKYLNPEFKKLNMNGIKNDITKSLKAYIKEETNREPMIMPIIMVL
ncbi:MAG: ribonuclease J [Candidatus Izemoplasmatales bacterium]|uniref:Ribonuclease J n=1 Tax=Hujiaoplasma nucleasis TaxID=2725268 RepID=A0A7L6N468_9MOLU|nr:ribonuclease J [Hujiaoplasma nucleasis]QLY40047.1 ribonuclease J [Hujiaoplasma nucleasis]